VGGRLFPIFLAGARGQAHYVLRKSASRHLGLKIQPKLSMMEVLAHFG
jgi:hypothetical protein